MLVIWLDFAPGSAVRLLIQILIFCHRASVDVVIVSRYVYAQAQLEGALTTASSRYLMGSAR